MIILPAYFLKLIILDYWFKKGQNTEPKGMFLCNLKQCSQGYHSESGWESAPSSPSLFYHKLRDCPLYVSEEKHLTLTGSPRPLGREDKNDKSVSFYMFTPITG